MATIWLPERDFLFSGVFYQHVFQRSHGLAVSLLEGVGIDVHGGAGLSVAQSGGHGAHVLFAGDQQRGGCVAQSVEGNGRQLLVWLLICVVPGYGVLKCGLGGRVGHLLSIILNEQPFGSLPVVTHR